MTSYRGEGKVIEIVLQYNCIRFLYFNKNESERAIAKDHIHPMKDLDEN